MKLKQALIEGGVVYGNPEMEYPKPTRDNCKRWKDNDGLCDGECYFTNSGLKTCYHEEVKKWNSGRLPFEDQDKVKEVLRVDKIMDAFENGKLQKLIDGKFDKHKDGLYSVDLDVTVVEGFLFTTRTLEVFLLETLPPTEPQTEAQVISLGKRVENQEEVKRIILEHESNYPFRPQKLRPHTFYSIPQYRKRLRIN